MDVLCVGMHARACVCLCARARVCMRVEGNRSDVCVEVPGHVFVSHTDRSSHCGGARRVTLGCVLKVSTEEYYIARVFAKAFSPGLGDPKVGSITRLAHPVDWVQIPVEDLA